VSFLSSAYSAYSAVTRTVTSVPAQDRQQLTELIVHILCIDKGLGHLGPEQPAVAVPQPGHGHLGGAFGHPQPRRRAAVTVLGRLTHQKPLERVEQFAPARLGELLTQPAEDTFQQGASPALIVDAIGCAGIGEGAGVARAFRARVQPYPLDSAATLERLDAVTVMGEEMFERAEEERAEATSLGVGSGQAAHLDQPREESLG